MDEEFNVEDLRTNNDTYYRMLGQFCTLNPSNSNKRSADSMEAGTSQEPDAKKLCTESPGSSSSNYTPPNLLTIPVELLDNILEYLDYGTLSKTRLVGFLCDLRYGVKQI